MLPSLSHTISMSFPPIIHRLSLQSHQPAIIILLPIVSNCPHSILLPDSQRPFYGYLLFSLVSCGAGSYLGSIRRPWLGVLRSAGRGD